ncbi:MAG: hypothetical protein WBV46_19190 [Terriglobales bacterium]|jgi:hypothetical protein
MMKGNCKFSLSSLSLLVVLGMFCLPSQAQGPAKRLSRFGRRIEGQAAGLVPVVPRPRPALGQSGLNFTFGLIDFPRSPDTMATGLNSRGDIVGLYGPNLPAYEGTEQSYVLEGNTFQELIYPGATYTGGLGINKSRKIVGWYTSPGDNVHAFLRTGKTYTNIDYPGSDNTLPIAINDSGVVIGMHYENSESATHGFFLKKGVYTSIDPPNSTYTEPLGINSAGVIVGDYEDQNFVNHGFIYQKGQFTTVDYPGASNTDLTGINDQGQMVGGYGDDVIVGAEDWPTPNPFFFDGTTFTPIQLPVDDAQVSWTAAFNGQQFVGLYVDSLGDIYGYQATIGH